MLPPRGERMRMNRIVRFIPRHWTKQIIDGHRARQLIPPRGLEYYDVRQDAKRAGLQRKGFGGVSPQHERRHGIGRDWLTLFECSLGVRVIDHTPRAQKNPPTPHQAAESSVEISRSGDRSSAHRPLRVQAPCRLQHRLPDSVSRITPDASNN
jgi:hypothetical protein